VGLKQFKPKTPSLRWKTVSTFEDLTRKRPEKKLTVSLSENSGRKNQGSTGEEAIKGFTD